MNERLVHGLSLRLFVSGEPTSSKRARDNLAQLRERYFPTIADVTIIDVAAEPQRAEEAQIMATPTLVVDGPRRQKRIVGDLTDTRKVLAFLGVEAGDPEGTNK